MAETEQIKEQAPPEVLEGQQCPVCGKNTLVLSESEKDVPYFGKAFFFSMSCESCGFHKADVETEKGGKPSKTTFEITSEDDMKIRVIKSASATVKLPRITTISPGETSNGYITNIEGIFNRVKKQIEDIRDNAEDKSDKTKAKNLLKKIRKIMWGEEPLTISIDDPTGNSAIVSEKAKVTKK